MSGFIGTKEAAKRLKISIRRVQALISAGRLPAERIGNSFVIRAGDLQLVNGRKNGRPHPGVERTQEEWNRILSQILGSLDAGPSDLSTNKKYMEGFDRKPHMISDKKEYSG